MRKIIILVLILGVLISLGAYYYKTNVYSRGSLKLEILASSEIDAFNNVEYIVKYKNNGNVVLEEPELSFQYPENSFPENDQPQRVIKKLEDIYPGEEKTVSFNGRVFGKEGETPKALASIRYKPRNLKAFYESNTEFVARIKFVPITFELDLPSRIEAGKEVDFSLNYFSNADFPVSGLRAKIEYPLSGFEFVKSNPQALDKTEWDLPLLNKAEGGRIQISGKISGELNEQKNFKATLGVWKDGKFILLKEVTKGVQILASTISLLQMINGSQDFIASPGDMLHYEIFFRNTGEESFQNLFLVARLEGKAFDFNTIKTTDGQFNKGDNSIIWDYQRVSKLGFLGQGEEGKVEFWVNLKDKWDVASNQEKNVVLKDNLILFQSRDDFENKVNSKLEIVQKGFFQDNNIFGNNGPVPPRMNSITTYTITWEAKNYFNDVRDVKVRAVLPQWVSLTGKILPQDARLTFDSQSRELLWQVGDLAATQGVLNPGPTVSFQVSFSPELSQWGQAPFIINQATISGEDAWTGSILQSSTQAINTTLPDDPTINGAGTVQ